MTLQAWAVDLHRADMVAHREVAATGLLAVVVTEVVEDSIDMIDRRRPRVTAAETIIVVLLAVEATAMIPMTDMTGQHRRHAVEGTAVDVIDSTTAMVTDAAPLRHLAVTAAPTAVTDRLVLVPDLHHREGDHRARSLLATAMHRHLAQAVAATDKNVKIPPRLLKKLFKMYAPSPLPSKSLKNLNYLQSRSQECASPQGLS